ncbi:glycosyltransferase family 4 protein [Micromonospora mirobrigensis]|uniref:Glycosyltransferase involved in cell wall bisynthesis n=1 Tax=Micromonospora mirobrigensis TaxID=262898 RepID=A0A1C4ZL21_9ACTN|nr:glycosyltransferase family 4 protein [Micromonospora mirobrigensis]SCF33618.1 Glycosyltransferase involved in cell wall bisynthesis [Micromonospora mirobrigensis]
MEAPAAATRHVLFLNWRDTRNPEGGGSEVYVERIAGELVRRGHRATLLCATHTEGPAEEITDHGVRVLRRGGRHTVYLRAALVYLAGTIGLGPLARRTGGRPDLIVDVGNGLPFLSALYARRPVIALVHHVHREQWPVVLGRWLARFGWWVESWLAPRVYRHCQYVTVSAATRRELATLGIDPQRVAIVHNGTPDMTIGPVPRSTQPSLVVLGRLVPHKQVEVALRAVAALAGELPGLTLTVAGQGWWESQLRQTAVDLGVAERVTFTGFVTDIEKRELLASAWVALTPSLKEGWGLTIVEAGAVGTPTVAFRGAGGVEEALVHGETGLLADDVDDFVAKVRHLLVDDAYRAAMGSAARAHAARFTWPVSGEKFAALVTRAANVPAGTPAKRWEETYELTP